MRNLLFAAFIMLAGLQAAAQSRLYLKPSAGIGFSNMNTSVVSKNIKPLTTYTGTIGVGFKKNKVAFETGIGYLRTGRRVPMSILFADVSKMSTEVHVINNHITVPFRLSYQLSLNRKLALWPTVGGSFSYNLSGSNRYTGPSLDHRFKLPNETFRRVYKTTGVFGDVQVNATYKFGKNLDIFGGPSFQYMITDMDKTSESYKNRPYTFGINAGVNLYLTEQNKPADTQTR